MHAATPLIRKTTLLPRKSTIFRAFARIVIALGFMAVLNHAAASGLYVSNATPYQLIIKIQSPSCANEYSNYGYPMQAVVQPLTMEKYVAEILCGDDTFSYSGGAGMPNGYQWGFTIPSFGTTHWTTHPGASVARVTADWGNNHSIVPGASACAASTLSWGSGGFCQSNAPLTNNGASIALTNTKAGAAGTAIASCTGPGTWTVTGGTCDASLTAPTSVVATDGTVSNAISISWGAAPGASTYRLQQRKEGASTWVDAYTGSAASFNWTGLNDESVFEFQVRAENVLGASAWSPIETGNIRKLIDPQFVSQSGVPLQVGVGQSFSYSQVWKNNGSETWAGGQHSTGPYGPADTSVWGLGNVAFSGSTATGATVTTSLTATAPSVPGTYPLQRIMQKSATTYGEASPIANVVVVGPPACSAITPDITTTYNANATVTVTLAGAASVGSASIKVKGASGGAASVYPMALNGANWKASFPIASHLSPGETSVQIEAWVANDIFPAAACATSTVAFDQLPLPAATLTPTVGAFVTQSGAQGFVVNRLSGDFAKIVASLPGGLSLSLKVEAVDANGNPILSALNNVNPGAQAPMVLTTSALNAVSTAWAVAGAVVRVSYADAAAASQGKVAEIPIEWMTTPGALQVTAQTAQGLPAAVNSRIKDGSEPYAGAAHGAFVGGLRSVSPVSQISPFVPVEAAGEWSSSGLDYAQLYNTQLVAVARAEPPAGVTLLQPWEYVSAAFTLPVQAPAQVQATDGTREDDVEITWPAPATGASIRYRVFRDETEITPPTGIPGTTVLDIPPERGVVYRYRVKMMVGSITSENESSDDGHILACRAARFIGASLNAQMTAVTGMVESWACLEGLTGSGSIAPGAPSSVAFEGSGQYRSFVYPLEVNLPDGGYVLRLNLESVGVSTNSSRTYDIPFTLNRASISVNNLTILYNGTPAANGVEANSIGHFGIRMEGGSGIGFAEEVK